MAAYVIVEVEITDPQLYAEYGKGVPGTVAAFGGKYLVRGGKSESKEGGWAPKRVVVLEFPSMERARSWYDSAEYKPLLAIRSKATKSKMVFVEGV